MSNVNGPQSPGPQSPGQQPWGPQAPGQQTPGQMAPGQQVPHQPAQPVAPKKSGAKTWIIVLSAVGAVALLAVGGVVLLPMLLGQIQERGAAAQAAAPREVVQQYMDALAAGDADTAWSFVRADEERSPLMTNEALGTAVQNAPITEISIGDMDEYGLDLGFGDIEVTFKIHGQTIVTDVTLEGPGSRGEPDEDWRIANQGIYDVLVIPNDVLPFTPTVNGVPVTERNLTVFPGAYTVAIDNERLTLAGTTEFLAGDVSSWSSPGAPEMNLEITEQTKAEFIELVRADIDECMQSKSLSTECGAAVAETNREGLTTIDGTVNRSLNAEQQAKLDAMELSEADPLNPLLVTTHLSVQLDATADCTDGQQVRQCDLLLEFDHAFGSASVDFGVEPPTVSWD